jgi:flagellar motor protein MotB
MIKLKNIIKESNIINLFEQGTVITNIVNWFNSNKPNTMKNLKTAGAAPGDLNQAIPSKTKTAGYGPGLSTIVTQMFAAYRKTGFNEQGQPTKLASKKGQWESTLETIPVKFNYGGQWVTNSDQQTPPVDSRHRQYIPNDVEIRLKTMNSYNIAQWKNGTQITNIIPTEVTENNYKRNSEKQLVRFITKQMGKTFMNKLITSGTKQQLILWLNYESKTVKDPGTPDVQLPATELTPLNVGDGFESGKADLKPDMIKSIQESIATMIEILKTAGIDINKIPVMTIQAGTDQEPLSRTSQYTDNAQLAAARANTFRELLIAGGIPKAKIAIDAKTNIKKGAALYTNDPVFKRDENNRYTSTPAERQAVIDQWRIDQAPFRFVRLNFAGLKINGRIIPGKEGRPDRLVQSMIKKQDTSKHKQTDEFVYKLTINMLK